MIGAYQGDVAVNERLFGPDRVLTWLVIAARAQRMVRDSRRSSNGLPDKVGLEDTGKTHGHKQKPIHL
jgi:hypothetical protein